MKTFKKLFAASALVLGLVTGNSAHAGVPVMDGPHTLLQTLMTGMSYILEEGSWMAQLGEMAEQIKQMEAQYKQMVDQYNSLNGLRNMGNSVISGNVVGQILPKDTAVKDWLKTGLDGWQDIANEKRKYDIRQSHAYFADPARTAEENEIKKLASHTKAAQDAVDTANKRAQEIKNLVAKLNSGKADAKQTADLAVAMQGTQALLQNDANQAAALKELAEQERRWKAQKAKERTIQAGVGPLVDW